jgi:tRNA threonylcarbamoyladenosine biosynthesis protein TsaB
MKILALDTATRQATVALCDDRTVVSEAQRAVTTHSEGLLQLIDELLGEQSLTFRAVDAVVCGKGPGSFTGLRIGMATAKGLCFASGVPLYCPGSLAALGIASATLEQSALAVLDAGRGEIFCELYQRGRRLRETWVGKPADVVRYFAAGAAGNAVTLVGPGVERYGDELRQVLPAAQAAEGRLLELRAADLVQAAWPAIVAGEAEDLHAVAPVYVRPPDIRAPAVT